jgi:hypothetical protein
MEDFYETAKPNFITVLADNQVGYPFSESFEETVALDGTLWSRASVEAENQWELTTTAASSGTSSLVLDNWDNGTLTRDELFGPPINLEGVSQMRVAFKYAFAGRNAATGSNKLQFMVTRNCETNWAATPHSRRGIARNSRAAIHSICAHCQPMGAGGNHGASIVF